MQTSPTADAPGTHDSRTLALRMRCERRLGVARTTVSCGLDVFRTVTCLLLSTDVYRIHWFTPAPHHGNASVDPAKEVRLVQAPWLAQGASWNSPGRLHCLVSHARLGSPGWQLPRDISGAQHRAPCSLGAASGAVNPQIRRTVCYKLDTRTQKRSHSRPALFDLPYSPCCQLQLGQEATAR